MQKYNFEEYVKKNKAEFTRLRLRSSKDIKHLSSCRPRSKTEEEILIKLDIQRWNKWQKEGKIRILGPGKFELRLRGR